MKIRMQRREFLGVLGWAIRLVPGQIGLPTAMEGVLITAEQDQVVLERRSYETSARAAAPATVADPGQVLVSAHLLASIAKVLPSAEEVELTIDGAVLVLAVGRAEFQLPMMPVEDHPGLPETPPVIGTIPAGEFAAALARVAPVAATDNGIPALTGIRLTITGSRLTLSATDRFRMASTSTSAWTPGPKTSKNQRVQLLPPAKVLWTAVKTVAAEAGNEAPVQVQVAPDNRVLGLACGTRSMTLVLMDSRDFPAGFDKLAPADDQLRHHVVVQAAELAAALERVGVICEAKGSGAVTLTCEGEEIQLAAGGENSVLGRCRDAVAATVDKPITEAFTIPFLRSLLGCMDGQVQLGFLRPQTACRLRPLTEDGTPRQDTWYLLAPLRLST